MGTPRLCTQFSGPPFRKPVAISEAISFGAKGHSNELSFGRSSSAGVRCLVHHNIAWLPAKITLQNVFLFEPDSLGFVEDALLSLDMARCNPEGTV